MTNEMQLFNYGDNAVRTIKKDGEVWFVAKDVCDILELTNAREAIKSLDDDEKMTVRISDGHSGKRGGAQSLNFINEPGLYKLAFRSNKPEAKKFTKWVASEVLPSIRKTGSYSVANDTTPATEMSTEPDDLDPKLKYLSRGIIRAAMQIVDLVFSGEEKPSEYSVRKVLALDKLFEASTGHSALELMDIKLKVECDSFHDEKRECTHYHRYLKWEHNFIPHFREYDCLPDDEDMAREIIEARMKED